MQRPTLEQFREEDGGYDYYGYDMALDQWRMQFPDLGEFWCGVISQVRPVADTGTEDLIRMLLA